jgi:uncharacterized protein YjbI with pentapeptide repeats
MRLGQRLAAGIAVALVVAVVLVAFDSTWPDWTGLKGRTLWDLAELVLVPLSLALIAYLLSGAQRREDRSIAERDRAADRELARSREQYQTVQDYLSTITELIRADQLTDERLRSVARSRTLTVLASVDGAGKRTVLQFLHEADLIAAPDPVIELDGADLRGADLSWLSLGGAELRGCDLTGADLRGAGASSARLRHAKLRGADLTDANLVHTELEGVSLDERTKFDKALLIAADFSKGLPSRASEVASVARRNREEADARWLDDLRAASWTGAAYDYSTRWPEGFDAAAAGMHDRSD